MTSPTATAQEPDKAPAEVSSSDETRWTTAEAITGLRSSDIFTIPGSVAVLDEEAVREALIGTDIQLLVLPHSGLDKEDRDIHHDKSSAVQDWADENELTLMVIDGLQIFIPPLYDLVPTDLGELQPVLLRHDLTSLVLSGIDRLIADAADNEYVDRRTDPVLESPASADPVLVSEIAQAWKASGIYSAPSLPSPIERGPSWDIDIPTRVAVFPALDLGEPLPALIDDLTQQFPDEVLIVVHGEWIEVAGPQQELLDAALLELYGEYYPAISEWGAPQAGLIRILIEKIGVWRSGVVADLAPPAAAPDPVNTIQPLLPWLFLLVALVIAAMVATGLRRRALRARINKTREQHEFDRAGAEMAMIAHRLLQADVAGTRTSTASEIEWTQAAERYRTARDILQRNGSGSVAREALAAARRSLDEAGIPDSAAPERSATGADGEVTR